MNNIKIGNIIYYAAHGYGVIYKIEQESYRTYWFQTNRHCNDLFYFIKECRCLNDL